MFSFWEPPWSVIYGIFSLWESLWIRWSMGNKQFRNTWPGGKQILHSCRQLVSFLQRQFRLAREPSAYWRRQPCENVGLHYMHGGEWKLSWSGVSVSQHRQYHYMWSSVYFCFSPTSDNMRSWTRKRHACMHALFFWFLGLLLEHFHNIIPYIGQAAFVG